MSRILIGIVAILIVANYVICWPGSDDDDDEDCPDIFLAKIRACEHTCSPYKESDEEDVYATCLWNGLRDSPHIRAYVADCKLKSEAFDKHCYKTVKRRIFFDCSLSKKINVHETCILDLTK